MTAGPFECAVGLATDQRRATGTRCGEVGGCAADAGLTGGWQPLHPLSLFVRAGRGAIAIFVVIVLPVVTQWILGFSR